MKIYLEILLFIIVIIILFYLFFSFTEKLLAPNSSQVLKSQVCFGNPPANKCFFVELAKSEKEREKGLMNRALLEKNKGMLFIFEKEGIYPFWMKNTLISLDIVWIDSNNKVVFINEDTQPCKSLICPQINPNVKAKYVLEINSGLAKEINLKIGDDVIIK